jgi:hypothetical protein
VVGGAALGSVFGPVGTVAGGIAAATVQGGAQAYDRARDEGLGNQEILQTRALPIATEAIGSGALQAIPVLKGASLLKTLGKNAAVQGVGSGALDAAVQLAEGGKVDLQRAASVGLAGAGMGAAGVAIDGRLNQGKVSLDGNQRVALDGPKITPELDEVAVVPARVPTPETLSAAKSMADSFGYLRHDTDIKLEKARLNRMSEEYAKMVKVNEQSGGQLTDLFETPQAKEAEAAYYALDLLKKQKEAVGQAKAGEKVAIALDKTAAEIQPKEGKKQELIGRVPKVVDEYTALGRNVLDDQKPIKIEERNQKRVALDRRAAITENLRNQRQANQLLDLMQPEKPEKYTVRETKSVPDEYSKLYDALTPKEKREIKLDEAGLARPVDGASDDINIDAEIAKGMDARGESRRAFAEWQKTLKEYSPEDRRIINAAIQDAKPPKIALDKPRESQKNRVELQQALEANELKTVAKTEAGNVADLLRNEKAESVIENAIAEKQTARDFFNQYPHETSEAARGEIGYWAGYPRKGETLKSYLARGQRNLDAETPAGGKETFGSSDYERSVNKPYSKIEEYLGNIQKELAGERTEARTNKIANDSRSKLNDLSSEMLERVNQKIDTGLNEAGLPWIEPPKKMTSQETYKKILKRQYERKTKADSLSREIAKEEVKNNPELAKEIVDAYLSARVNGVTAENPFFESLRKELNAAPVAKNAGELSPTPEPVKKAEPAKTEPVSSKTEPPAKPKQQNDLLDSGKVKSKPQIDATSKTLEDLLQDNDILDAYNLALDDAGRLALRTADEGARAGTRIENVNYNPKTGLLSSTQEGIKTKKAGSSAGFDSGDADKLVSVTGVGYNPRSKRFYVEGYNNNYQKRRYLIPKKGEDIGSKFLVRTEKPSLVGEEASVYASKGNAPDLDALVDDFIEALDISDLTRALDTAGQDTGFKYGLSKLLADKGIDSGNYPEVRNYVREVLSDPVQMVDYLKRAKIVKGGFKKLLDEGDWAQSAHAKATVYLEKLPQKVQILLRKAIGCLP